MDITFSNPPIISSYYKKPVNLHLPPDGVTQVLSNQHNTVATVRRSGILTTNIPSETPTRKQSVPEIKSFISPSKNMLPSSLKRDLSHLSMKEARETFLTPKNQNFAGQQPSFEAFSKASKRQGVRHKSEMNLALKEEVLMQKSKHLELPLIPLNRGVNSPSSQQTQWGNVGNALSKRNSVDQKDLVNLQNTLQQYQAPKLQRTPTNHQTLFSQHFNPFIHQKDPKDKKDQNDQMHHRQELIHNTWSSTQSLTQIMSTRQQQQESNMRPPQLPSLVLADNNDDAKSIKTEASVIFASIAKRIETQWLDRINDSTMPKGVEHCTLAAVGTKIYMFSNVMGTAAPTDQKFALQYCPLQVYNILKGKWKTPKTTSEFAVLGRIGHTTVLMKNQLYVFGGATCGKDQSSKNSTIVSELIIYHPTLKKWTRPTKNSPPPRKFHAACGRDGLMVIYGGIDPKGRFLNDVWVYDSADSSFWELSGDNLPDPEGLAYHSMVGVFNSSKSSLEVKAEGFYCYGGWNSRGEHNNTLKIMTLPSLIWVKPKTRGKQPPYKIEPSVSYHEKSRSLIVCGGKPILAKKTTESQVQGPSDIFVLCLETFIWTQVTPKGELSFKERHRHAAVCYRDEMIIFGGFGYGGYLADSMDKLLITSRKSGRTSIQASTAIFDDKDFKPVRGATSLNEIPDL